MYPGIAYIPGSKYTLSGTNGTGGLGKIMLLFIR
jgi:hypothetical protein